jgi:hypothetical protein
MNKKLWMGAGVVFVALGAMEMLFNSVFASSWQQLSHLMRPETEIKMHVVVITWAFFAYFFTWIWSKGYESKGFMEGIRYGLAVSLMMVVPWAYGSYAYLKDFPYSLALMWFIIGTLENIVCGVLLAWIYGMKPKQEAAA